MPAWKNRHTKANWYITACSMTYTWIFQFNLSVRYLFYTVSPSDLPTIWTCKPLNSSQFNFKIQLLRQLNVTVRFYNTWKPKLTLQLRTILTIVVAFKWHQLITVQLFRVRTDCKIKDSATKLNCCTIDFLSTTSKATDNQMTQLTRVH